MPAMRTLARRALDRYRSEGLAAAARASARHVLRTALQRLERDETDPARQLTSVDLPGQANVVRFDAGTFYDVILATDLRFPGGSSSSSAQEIEIQSRAGLVTGVYHLDSEQMRFRSAIAPIMERTLGMSDVHLLNLAPSPPRTRLLLFRHPAILNPDRGRLPEIVAEAVALIVNHPPVKFGRIEYLLTDAIRRLRDQYGCEPEVYPIGPLVRQAVNHHYDGKVKLAEDDWVNVFDLDRFATERTPPPATRALRIGRHSRPNREKWPADPRVIRAAYPEDDGIEVHVLGGADVPLGVLGRRPPNWHVHEFGAMDAAEFLKRIDVFVYFHHPDWLEAFGRVIVEAMAASLPVVLPPHFRPLLGEAAIYCEPQEVRAVLSGLRDPVVYMRHAEASRDAARERFGHRVHLSRLARFGARGKTSGVQPDRPAAGRQVCRT